MESIAYRRIVLAYDGSREGRAALREGALAARRLNGKVFLLCVIAETPGVRVGEAAYAGAVAQTHESHQSLFDEAMGKLAELGFDVEGKIVAGEPAVEIAAYARKVGADLVVVGHRKKGLLERWWSGKTGAYLADHLDCSLLVARNTISDDAFAAAMQPAPADAHS